MEVLGVFVVRNKNGYTGPALKHAEDSQFEILLTDIESLHHDLSNYPLQKTGHEKTKKKINKMHKAITHLSKRVKELEGELEKQRDYEKFFYYLIILIIGVLMGSCITLFFYKLINN